ncbi:DUF4173 domain-containing protein [Crocinitomix sp.]|nr:DUF4173 domain-containing protein [Crocinitomix sp.]
MSKKILTYLLVTLAITSLFYDEFWGLNAFLSAIIFIIGIVITTDKTKRNTNLNSFHWWFAVFLFVANGFASFYIHNQFSGILFYFSLFYFAAINAVANQSLPIGTIQGTYSFFTGFYNLTTLIGERLEKSKTTAENKKWTKSLIYIIPIIIFIIFLKLYQTADETFYEWTKFINLDWVSWGFIGFFLLLTAILYGIFFLTPNEALVTIENKASNTISNNYDDKAQRYMGIENEGKIAKSILVMLILMLGLYNFIDLRFIFSELYLPNADFRYSALLHGGVDALIFSIVFVILIISYLFRGQLNFRASKSLKIVAIIWLAMNLLMIATTSIKAAEYITHWGLTYKRIGVYIYLILATAGLLLTIIKVLKIKSFWFLLRNTSLAFFTCFTLMGLIDWDKRIVSYNLQLSPTQIDFNYLHNLGQDTYPDLLDYYRINNQMPHIKSDPELWNNVFNNFDMARERLRYKKTISSWRSMVWREHTLLNRMNLYQLKYKKQFYRGS